MYFSDFIFSLMLPAPWGQDCGGKPGTWGVKLGLNLSSDSHWKTSGELFRPLVYPPRKRDC